MEIFKAIQTLNSKSVKDITENFVPSHFSFICTNSNILQNVQALNY